MRDILKGVELRNNDEGHSMEGEKTVPTHKTATREQRLAERLKLLKAEKELTRRSDAYCHGRGRARSVPTCDH